MATDFKKEEWLYLEGVEVRGPVSLEQLATLIAAGTVKESVMVATKEAPQWRPAAQILREQRPAATPVGGAKESKSTISLAEDLLRSIGNTLSQVAGTEKLEGFSLKEMFSETLQGRSVAEMEDYLIVGTDKTTPRSARCRRAGRSRGCSRGFCVSFW